MLTALLGLTVLAGWYTHNLALIHVLPAFVGMAFNTALGFLLAGVSLAAAAAGRPRWALLGVGFALLVALPTLAEYALGRSLGIDELFMHAYTRSGITQFGRMAFATAVCFFGAGLAGLRLNLPEGLPGRGVSAGLLGAITAGLGVIALSGYVSGITEAYAWGQLTRMAVHTAAGFVLLGTGLTALAWTEARRQQQASPRWLAGLAGIAGATASLCLWQALIVHERAQTALLARLAARMGVPGLPHSGEMLTHGALGAGLLVSALLAGAVWLAQTARRQAAALEQATHMLEARVQERTAALADANEALEMSNAALATANRAVRDILHAVTDGKLHVCEETKQLPPAFGPRPAPIPLHRQDVRSLRHHVRQKALEAGLTPSRAGDLETAVGEAGMNAAVHGVDGFGEVYVSERGTVQVWVRDRGRGIDMEHLPRATLERGYTTTGTLGHGFWLILSTVDRVWLLTGAGGTTLVLEQDSDAPPSSAWLRSVLEA